MHTNVKLKMSNIKISFQMNVDEIKLEETLKNSFIVDA